MDALTAALARRWVWRVWVLLVGALGLNCRDSTGPRVAGHLAFAPAFQSAAAGIVDFDRIRITVVRPGSGPVLDTTITIPPTADSIDLSLAVPLVAAREDMLLYMRLINAAGDTVFRNAPYPQQVSVTAGGSGTPVQTPIEYVGVGYDAVAIFITTPGTVVLTGQALPLSAVVMGPNEQAIPGTPIEWTSLDSQRVRVPDRAVGQVVGGGQRGVARIVARLLTGPADTVLVTAQPVPSALARVSGDSQTGVPGAALPLPLRVRVTASDGLGVQAPVTFLAIDAGASVSASLVMSDTTGYAETVATLGPGVGPQRFEASVSGIAAPAAFTELAVAAGPPPPVIFAGDSAGGLASGVYRVNPDGSGQFRLNDRGRFGAVHPRWSPDRLRAAFTFADLGPNALYVVAATGDTSVLLVSDTSARRARWSSDGARLAFECGDGFSPQQDVCVIPDVTGPIAGLDRRGEGAGKIFVTDFDPSKREGPGAFAWNPLDATTLVVVRDSLTAASETVSRLFLVRLDGTLVRPLSAPLLDPQKSVPLQIVGPLDWSANGATIVFSARDPLVFDATTPTGQRLYAINQDGLGLRQLTPGPAFDSRPVISPDGTQVLFVRDANCSADYWRVGVGGTGETQVSAEAWCDFSAEVLGNDWSPDGKDIVLVGSEPPGSLGTFAIYRIPAGTTAATYTGNRALIGRAGFVHDIQPSWRP